MKKAKYLSGWVIIFLCFIFVLNVQATNNSGFFVYLPMVIKPPFAVADFNSCDKVNNLGGEMGAAYKPATSDRLLESYEPEAGKGCVAALDYEVVDEWSAFWLKLLGADLDEYQTLTFDVKFVGQADPTTNMEIRIELKRSCQDQDCNEVWIQYAPVTTDTWETQEISLSDFAEAGGMPPPPPLTSIEELVFTFEKGHISSKGVVYLDNIVLKP